MRKTISLAFVAALATSSFAFADSVTVETTDPEPTGSVVIKERQDPDIVIKEKRNKVVIKEQSDPDVVVRERVTID